MNQALEQLAREVRLDGPANERLRLAFGYACASRVLHLLEEPAVAECLHALGQFLDGSLDRARLDEIARRANAPASQEIGQQRQAS